MTADPSHEVFTRLAALYALGGLDGSERELFEQHLEICQACVDEVRSFLPITRGLVFAAPSETPPPGLRESIVGDATPAAQLSTAPSPVPPLPAPPARQAASSAQRPASQPAQEPRRMSGPFRLLAALCLVIAGALGWYAAQQVNVARELQTRLDDAMLQGQVADLDAATSRQAAQELRARADTLAALDATSLVLEGQPGAENAFGRVFLSTTRGVVIAASSVPPVPAGRTYQVWFVLPEDPVSVGFAHVDSEGRLFESIDPPPDASQLIAVAVTMEPEGGVDMPSGNVLLLGRVNQ